MLSIYRILWSQIINISIDKRSTHELDPNCYYMSGRKSFFCWCFHNINVAIKHVSIFFQTLFGSRAFVNNLDSWDTYKVHRRVGSKLLFVSRQCYFEKTTNTSPNSYQIVQNQTRDELTGLRIVMKQCRTRSQQTLTLLIKCF